MTKPALNPVCPSCAHARDASSRSLYLNSLSTGPLQLPNRSLLWSRRNIPCLRDFAELGKRRRHGGDRAFKSHRRSPHPPRHRLPSNDPIKTAQQSAQQVRLRAQGSLGKVLTFVGTNPECMLVGMPKSIGFNCCARVNRRLFRYLRLSPSRFQSAAHSHRASLLRKLG